MKFRTARALCAVAPIALVFAATPAQAGTGCNGVWNIVLWGCAPWDNNNGPQYYYYKKRQVVVKAEKIENRSGASMALSRGQWYPMVAAGGGNMVAAGGGNVAVWVQN